MEALPLGGRSEICGPLIMFAGIFRSPSVAAVEIAAEKSHISNDI
jgi:hypothetical protein